MSVKLTCDEILSRVYDKLPNNIVILDDSEVFHIRSKIKTQCTICKKIKTRSVFGFLYGNVGCAACKNATPKVGNNDIATKAPWVIPYLKREEDATRYSLRSNRFIDVKCPVCGYEGNMQISHLTTRGFACPVCSDSISYPNKFARSFLLQLPVENLDFEYSPSWISPYRYDNYFEYMGDKYILEMDGGLGHGTKNYCNDKKFDGAKRDKLKDDKAKERNIEVIRIDCLLSDAEYIKKNMRNSKLGEIFDLSQIDWNKCEQYCATSLLQSVCNEYNKGTKSTQKLANQFHLGICTIQRYLRTGTKIGICDYEKNSWIVNHNNKQDHSPKETYVYDKDGTMILQTRNLKEGISELNRRYGNVFNYSSVASKLHCNHDIIDYKGFKFVRKIYRKEA